MIRVKVQTCKSLHDLQESDVIVEFHLKNSATQWDAVRAARAVLEKMINDHDQEASRPFTLEEAEA